MLAREREAIKNFLLRRIVSKVKDTEAVFVPPSDALITQAEQDLVAFAASNVAVIEIVPIARRGGTSLQKASSWSSISWMRL